MAAKVYIPEDQEIRVAVFGSGSGYYPDGNANTVAICELSEEARQRAAKAGYDVYTPDEMDKMLARKDINLVVIKTPNFCHAKQAVASLNAGKHVWVEKPMGITHEELDAIAEAKKRSGMQVQNNLELRNSKLFVRVKEIAKELGMRPLNAFIRTLDFNMVASEKGVHMTPWRMKKELSGGELLEKVIHYVDQCIWWMDDRVRSVRCICPPIITAHYEGIHDNMVMNMMFDNGGTSMLQWCQFGAIAKRYDFGLIGDTGALFCNWVEAKHNVADDRVMEISITKHVLDKDGKVLYSPLLRRESYAGRHPGEMGHDSVGCYNAFVDYLRGRREDQTISFEDAMHSTRVCLAGEESAVSGKDVEVRRD